MKTLLKGGRVYYNSELSNVDLLIEDGKVFDVRSSIPDYEAEAVIHCDNCFIIPGLIDVHVHFREPGFEYKETIATGSAAAAAGGYTTVCTMPNLNPAPWNMENLEKQLVAIEAGGKVRVLPYGRITGPAAELGAQGEGNTGNIVANLEEMAPYVFAFSDDGAGVQEDVLMEEAMTRAKALGKVIVAHSEDTNYPPEDSRSEWKQVERDIELVRKTGCSYHVCHVSTKESVDLIRRAKAEGLDVTCETAPHYLLFTKAFHGDRLFVSPENASEHSGLPGGNFKMNPPLRDEEDKQALLEGIKDGTIDMIATDHAPHSAEEKSKGFEGSLNGIIGLETAFPVMYSALVLGMYNGGEGIITFEKLIELMSGAPARRFGIEGGRLEPGAVADLAIVNFDEEFVIDPATFRSKGRSTPFEGMKVRGSVYGVMVGGIPIE